ncbi:hypothetical protein C8R43DRAFT_1018745 [Mycena crocata]|nr:hypothetical protein C8R43DRAFT_1018745 [Mycena crocata]
MSSKDEKVLDKAKNAFLKHLKQVDTSNGPVNDVIIKFRLGEVESAFDNFVKQHGCKMTTRIISRAEQDAIDPRCAQYTSVLVTPEAQARFQGEKSKAASASPKGRKPPVKNTASGRGAKNTQSAPPLRLLEVDEDSVVMIPRTKYNALRDRLSEALLLLPTTDPTRGKECRDELIDIAHELRGFSVPKRSFSGEEEEDEEAAPRPKKSRRSYEA